LQYFQLLKGFPRRKIEFEISFRKVIWFSIFKHIWTPLVKMNRMMYILFICSSIFVLFTFFLCKSHRIIHFYQHKSAFSSSAMSVTYAFNYRFEKLRFKALKILNENGHLSKFSRNIDLSKFAENWFLDNLQFYKFESIKKRFLHIFWFHSSFQID